VIPAPFDAQKWQHDPAYREELPHQKPTLFRSQVCEHLAPFPGSVTEHEWYVHHWEWIIAKFVQREEVI
jgi:hypothetical protein